jgi:hypothetical protein
MAVNGAAPFTLLLVILAAAVRICDTVLNSDGDIEFALLVGSRAEDDDRLGSAEDAGDALVVVVGIGECIEISVVLQADRTRRGDSRCCVT